MRLARGYIEAVTVCLAILAGLGFMFLLPYVGFHYRYPVGWDATAYVWRANAVAFDGLARTGTVRAGSPILAAQLMRVSGQNAFTMVALLQPVLAGVAGLGSATLVRAGLGVRPPWIAVIGVLAWVSFGHVGIVDGHLDNALNAALILSGFGAATVWVASGRGAIAVALLFMAAGVAEWPFFAFDMAVFLVALMMFSWPNLFSGPKDHVVTSVRPLLWATLASAALTALTFLGIPKVGGVGARISSAYTRGQLRARFFLRLHALASYWAYPLGLLGGVISASVPVPPSRRSARRLFVSLMAAWTLVTAFAALLQTLNVPVAGERLLSYFFPATILTGVFVWWLAGRLAGRVPGNVGRAAAAMVVVAALLGFGSLAWATVHRWRPWVERTAVAQVSAAATYVAHVAPERPVVYALTTGSKRDGVTVARWWNVVRAALPADQVPRAVLFAGLPSEALNEEQTATGQRPLVVVLEEYDRSGFAQAPSLGGRGIALGVAEIGGPSWIRPARLPPPPIARTTALDLLWLSPLVVALLFAAGSGWAVALLPSDPLVRVALTPGLGLSTAILTGLVWDRIGLPLGGWGAAGSLALSTVAGWALVWMGARRRGDVVRHSDVRGDEEPEGGEIGPSG